jgi:signal transduction histidine kinase
MSQKMEALGRLAGGIAHDCNNLLFVVSAELEGLRLGLEARGSLEPAQAESFDLLAQVLEQSSGFNRRLLEFSRNREGRPVRTTLGAVLGQAARVLRQAAGPTVRLVLPALAADPPVVVDPVQVEQVLLNLVVNARDAMPRGGVLTLAIEAPAPGEAEAAADGVGGGAWARLRVTDTGEGIPAAVIDRIFEPFFTTKSATNGTGLGLSTSFSILQAAGGCIRVSSAPGVGTTFRVYLPVAPG